MTINIVMTPPVFPTLLGFIRFVSVFFSFQEEVKQSGSLQRGASPGQEGVQSDLNSSIVSSLCVVLC